MTTSIPHAFDLNDVNEFIAPTHLAVAYNDGEIPSFEDVAILSAQYYMREVDSTKNELQTAKSALAQAVEEKTAAVAKLVRHENLAKSLEDRDSQISTLKLKLITLEPLAITNDKLAAENERLKIEQERQATILSDAENQAKELVGLKKASEEQRIICDANESLIEKLEQDLLVKTISLNARNDRVANLEQQVKTLEAEKQKLLEDIKDANAAKRIEQERNSELVELSRQSANDIDRAKEACNKVSQTLVKLNKNQIEIDRENRLLSLYVNSHSTAPMYETPEGHTLRALMLDKDRICSADGKEIIEDNTAIFIWNNPNGFSCIVALSNNPNEDRLLLMPSLCDPNLMTEGSPEHAISNDITNRITPAKEYREDIAKHIRAFDVTEFKRTMLKSFQRANYIAKRTEHLDVALEDIYANGTPEQMEALLTQCDEALGTTSRKIKDARRPRKSPASKAKKRKSKR